MAKCSGITQAGTACKGIPIEGSQWCHAHHPDRRDERRRHGSRGGKRGGRGRPTGELARLGARFEELADKLLNGARACVRDGLTAREQEELIERMEQLEEGLQAQKGSRYGA
jgi:hypothetical protein